MWLEAVDTLFGLWIILGGIIGMTLQVYVGDKNELITDNIFLCAFAMTYATWNYLKEDYNLVGCILAAVIITILFLPGSLLFIIIMIGLFILNCILQGIGWLFKKRK